jgi:proline iminopeptidase
MRLPAAIIFVHFFSLPFIVGKPIHESLSVKAGNISQWIKIDGENDQNSVLLYLHGGPGNSVMRYSNRFTDELQKPFVVVQWDQRETGKTGSLNKSTAPLTVALFENDALEVINYLKIRFHQKKIILVGHSWGGFLTLLLAAHHPEQFAGCFAAAPMIHQVESEQLAIDKMKEVADQQNNKKALEELTGINLPFQNGKQLFYHRKWLYELVNKQKAPFSQQYVENWSKKWLTVFNEASEINFGESAPEIKCPIYFLIGRNDFQTNSRLTEKYFEKLKAEKKELFWFEDSAHGLNLTESRKFQQVIISKVGHLND